MLVILSYSNVSAVMIVSLFLVVATPLLRPLKKLPSLVISTSVTLKSNSSFAFNKLELI